MWETITRFTFHRFPFNRWHLTGQLVFSFDYSTRAINRSLPRYIRENIGWTALGAYNLRNCLELTRVDFFRPAGAIKHTSITNEMYTKTIRFPLSKVRRPSFRITLSGAFHTWSHRDDNKTTPSYTLLHHLQIVQINTTLVRLFSVIETNAVYNTGTWRWFTRTLITSSLTYHDDGLSVNRDINRAPVFAAVIGNFGGHWQHWIWSFLRITSVLV